MTTASPADSAPGTPTVAVLGTGIMGSGMARSLLRDRLPVRVWNRTRSKAEPLAAARRHRDGHARGSGTRAPTSSSPP